MIERIKWAEAADHLPLTAFKPNPKNPKKHTKAQLEHIKASILRFGFLDPIGVWGDENLIVEGHGRVKALEQLAAEGKIEIPAEGVPCTRVDHLSRRDRDAYMLEHNQATMETDWDGELLDELLGDIAGDGLDMSAFGFDVPDGEEDDERPEIEFTEELREEHNYVVLYFDNDVDWLQAETLFGIEPKYALPTKRGKTSPSFARKGIGRVLNGAKALERIMRHADLS